MTRYPLAPLEALVTGPLAEALGCDRQQIARWRRYGIDEVIADRLAVRLGWVSWQVWPELLEDVTRTCDERGCEVRFVPTRSTQRFCCPQCRDREGVRRRYHENPEPKKASRRAYYQEAAEYERKQARHRYHYNVEASRARKRAQRAAKAA